MLLSKTCRTKALVWPSKPRLKSAVCISVRTSFQGGRNLTLKEAPLRQRLSLLVIPTGFTISVGVGTYLLSEKFKMKTGELRNAEFKRAIYQMQQGSFDLHSWWSSQLPGAKVVLSIISANVCVFLLWRSGAALPLLYKYMLANAYGEARTLSMVGSMFSHKDLWHVFINMYVLYSVANVIPDPAKFFHVYMTGGLTAALGSYIRAVLLPRNAAHSLGASGAILAMLGYTMLRYPESRFSIALVDQLIPHSFSARTAFICIATFDTLGLILSWKLFDHAAHLFGLSFGGLKGLTDKQQHK